MLVNSKLRNEVIHDIFLAELHDISLGILYDTLLWDSFRHCIVRFFMIFCCGAIHVALLPSSLRYLMGVPYIVLYWGTLHGILFLLTSDYVIYLTFRLRVSLNDITHHSKVVKQEFEFLKKTSN